MRTHRSRTAAGLRLAVVAALPLAWLGAGIARADPTPPTTIPLADITYPTGPQYIGMEPWMTSTGWDVREAVFTYNTQTDTLTVDLKTTGIAGDADGNGNPGGPDPRLTAVGGINPANLGGLDSITVAFNAATANGQMGGPIAIAGVPEFKVGGATGLDGFELAQYVPGPYGLQVSYGNPIATAVGTLLYNPSAQHPDFEFTIQNFSKLTGLTMANGFYFSAYAGSPNDAAVGEDHIDWTRIGGLVPGAQVIPPPGTGNPAPPPFPTPAPSFDFTGPPPPSPTPSPSFHTVPEPASVALFGVGGGALWLVSRARRNRPAA